MNSSGAVELRQAIGSTRVHTATDGRDVLVNDPDGWEVERPWLWWAGPAGGDGVGGPFGNPIPGAGLHTAGNLPAVARCTSIICDTIGGLPWRVYRGFEQLDTPDWLADPQARRADGRIVDPGALDDTRMSAVEFWTQWLTAALWWGDGYLYVPVRDADGAPKPPLWQLHPHDVDIRDGAYWVQDVPLPSGSVIQLRGAPPYTKGHGQGVLTRHGRDLGLAATVREYAAGVFASGIPAGYIKVNAPNPSQDQVSALKDTWMRQHGGARRSIAVLNATTEFHPIAISPVDAQLDMARQWSLRDVAMAFGLPAFMLDIPGDRGTYANIESRFIETRAFGLLPWSRRVESVIDAELPRGTELKIVMDGTLRADTATRYAAYKVAIEAGFMTVNEVRALEDRPPMAAVPSGLFTAPGGTMP